MRWRTTPTPEPKHEDKRARLVFAWRPTIIGDHVVWLERFQVHERFFRPVGGAPGWWSETGSSLYDPCYY